MTRLTRTMLFVPAARPAMIAKAAASAADAVCIDLEDSVPPEAKAPARANAATAFRELDFGRRVRMLRVNGLDTPYAYRDVVDVVEAAGDRIDLVMLPKAGSAQDVAFWIRCSRRSKRTAVSRGGSGSRRRSRRRRGFCMRARLRARRPGWRR